MAKYGPTVCEGVMPDMSGLGRSLVAAAQHDAELVGERPVRHRDGEIEARDHPPARLLVRDGVEDRIVGHQWIAREIHLRDEPRQERAPEQGEMDVRRPPGIGMIAPWVGAGLDRDELVAAF